MSTLPFSIIPFSCREFDTLYNSIASVLKTTYPQLSNETLLEWYKRLLYNLMAYIEAKYEATTTVNVVNANSKTNKKKDNPSNTSPIPPDTLFASNIEKALDIVSQDPKFGVYLLSWWLPILINIDDWFEININIDNSNTLAKDVLLTNIELGIELMTSKITVKSINGIDISTIQSDTFDMLRFYPFIGKLFKIINRFKHDQRSIGLTLNTFKESKIITSEINDISINSVRLATLLYEIHILLQPLFISDLTITSDLVGETPITNTIALSKTKSIPRKTFNSRKFLNTNKSTVSSNDMSMHIIETLIISIFKTFYDYDEDTINPLLFQYLFQNKSLNDVTL